MDGRREDVSLGVDLKGGTATGRQSARVSLDGFAVLMDYEQEQRREHHRSAPRRVEMIYLKDSVDEMHWVDLMGSPAEVFKGAFNGDVLTVSHGGPMHARMTYDFSQGAAKIMSK